MEQYESVLFQAVKKAEVSGSNNIGFLCYRAEYLLDCFGCGEISGIYLNFSDPWHKKRHAKRRLTSDRFLEIYNTILDKDGFIEFKTDNENLYNFSLESFTNCPHFETISQTTDLYNDPVLFSKNIPTEYEIKFQSQGHPIFKIVAKKTV